MELASSSMSLSGWSSRKRYIAAVRDDGASVAHARSGYLHRCRERTVAAIPAILFLAAIVAIVALSGTPDEPALLLLYIDWAAATAASSAGLTGVPAQPSVLSRRWATSSVLYTLRRARPAPSFTPTLPRAAAHARERAFCCRSDVCVLAWVHVAGAAPTPNRSRLDGAALVVDDTLLVSRSTDLRAWDTPTVAISARRSPSVFPAGRPVSAMGAAVAAAVRDNRFESISPKPICRRLQQASSSRERSGHLALLRHVRNINRRVRCTLLHWALNCIQSCITSVGGGSGAAPAAPRTARAGARVRPRNWRRARPRAGRGDSTRRSVRRGCG